MAEEKRRRGFAAMDRAKQREIASKGGKAAHEKGTAHEFTPEQARAAGRKGGQAAHRKGTAHEFTRQEAQAAGRKGGLSSRNRARKQAETPDNNNPAAPVIANTPEVRGDNPAAPAPTHDQGMRAPVAEQLPADTGTNRPDVIAEPSTAGPMHNTSNAPADQPTAPQARQDDMV